MKIINTSPNKVVNSQDFEKHSFGIKSKNLHYIIGLLRNDLYSDKLLAVIREYSCNAYDANVEAGNGDKPICITLPSKLEPVFKVRDFGDGLSKKDIVDIFISYAESTKRGTNAQIGQMGIGSKAAFCYGDSFTVTSFHNGIKTVYDCVLDSNDVGDCLVLLNESTNEPDGIEITVNIKTDDVNEFNKKAWEFFKYWDNTPEFVGFDDNGVKENFNQNNVEKLFSGTRWAIYSDENGYSSYRSSGKSKAVMGNIAYPLDWSNVRFDKLNENDFNSVVTKDELNNVISFIKSSNVVVKLDIGDVQFAPSREALQYNDYTNKALLGIVGDIIKEVSTSIQSEFDKCEDMVDAFDKYDEIFSYGSPANALKSYFNDKLTYNGIHINSNEVNVSKFYSTEGYKDTTDDSSNNNYYYRNHHLIIS